MGHTPCRGGADASGYCAVGRTGPLCQLCRDPDHYVTGAGCARCKQTGLAAWLISLSAALGACLAIGLVCRLCRCHLTSAAEVGLRLARRVELGAKLKLVLAYLQVVLVMPEAFDVPLPPEYFEVTGHVHVHVQVHMGVGMVHVECGM